MGFYGISSSAMEIIRNNRALLHKRSIFKRASSKFDDKPLDFGGNGLLTNNGADPILLRKIREKTLREHGRQRRKFVIFLMLALPIIIYFGYKAFHNFSFGFPPLTTKESKSHDFSKKYLFYINDGDAWLRKWHYHNAIFQYRKALELYPGNYEARYRIAIAYSYQCQYAYEGCEDGKKLVEELKREFPKRSELSEVEKVFTHWGTP